MALFNREDHEKRNKARAKRKLTKKEAREQSELKKQLAKEAKGYEEIIARTAWHRKYREILRGALAPTVLEYWLAGKTPYRGLKFTHALLDEYRIWLRINSRDLPGISHADIYDPDFLYDLSRAVNKTVKYSGSPGSGDFIMIERDSSNSGIPNFLSMKKAFAWLQEANADVLAFCMGQAENNQPLIVSLLQLPHLFVSGTTRQGKSVCLNNIFSTFALRCSPEDVQFALIDFKSGLEFGPYEGLPHLIETPGTETRGIAFTPAEAKIVLNSIISEMARRGRLFKQYQVRNIDEYHQAQKEDHLSYLVVGADELSLLMFHPDRDLQKMGKQLLNTVVASGAAYGVHMVAASQDPTKEVLPRIIKQNFGGFTAFRAKTIASSIAVLGNMKAYKLRGKGRGIFQLDEDIEFQGPYISTSTVKRIVRTVRAYHLSKPTGKAQAGLGLPDLLLYALEHFQISDGEWSLAWDRLDDVFAPQGLSAERIRKLLPTADNRTFEIDGNIYLVKPGKGRTGRRLVWQHSIGVVSEEPDAGLLVAD